MRLLPCLIVFLAFTFPSLAQDAQDDKSFLESKLQEVLSGVGRDVQITGFEGALSSNAQLDQLTISDADGVWLTLRDAELIWTRSALLAGRLEVETLTAREVEMTRLPRSDTTLELSDTQASPFALPELPVSINIGMIRIRDIKLGAEVLGEPATLTLEGRVALAEGDGNAALTIMRTDRDDQLVLDGAFSNASRDLRLNFDFSEAASGLVSTLLSIPGKPALGLQVTGDAPISDYTAQIALSSDGAPRFGGQVRVQATPDSYAVQADLDGDVRPLFSPDLHPFFGESASLTADALFRPDGRTELRQLDITSGAMQLSGSLELSENGWPERFDLTGQIADEDPVRLPLSGPPTTVDRATITARYDATSTENWIAQAELLGFARDSIEIDRATLSGSGTIGGTPVATVTGDVAFTTEGVRPFDAALASALGATPEGRLSFEWRPDAPFHMAPLILETGNTKLELTARVDQLADGLPLTGEGRLQSTDLSRLSGLAGRPLGGAISARIRGSAVLLSGAFDLNLTAQSLGLKLNQLQLDPLLTGQADLTVSAKRDETGTALNELTLKTATANIQANGRLNTDAGDLFVAGQLADVSLVEPRLTGAVTAKADLAWQTGAPLTLQGLDITLDDTQITANGTLQTDDPLLPVEGSATLVSDNLARFSKLAGRNLAGRIAIDLDGNGQIRGDGFDLAFDMDGSNVQTGIGQLDTLIAGDISATGAATLNATAFDLQYLKLAAPRLRLNASGSGPSGPISIAARLSDLSLVNNAISGPAEARGTVVLEDRLARRVRLDLNATGPGGITAQISGGLNDYAQTLSLSLRGTAPLQLANRFITPRSVTGETQFDLSLNGPPRLASLSGQATFAEARAAMPRLNIALTDLTGGVTLSDGQAQVQVTGGLGAGGRFEVSGPIGLSAPFSSVLQVGLTNLVITDGEIYDTSVDGAVTVTGPLTGGAVVGGVLNLGETELRIPSGSGTIIGTLPELTHIAEPARVNQSRRRAGLIIMQSRSPSASFPIDLTINAPNRIFVRGRGLDAELGGQMRLTGSTADVQASGVFELIRGRLDLLGKRLVLTEGLIDMRGALDPFLRFVAEITEDDVLVRVILEGLASEPSVLFTSSPDLPQEEIVARLLFGRGLDTISPFQAAQLVSAVATLTGRYDGGVVGKLRNALGLSDLDISTTNEGATQLRAGAYISDNVYSEVTADSEGKQQINLNLDLSDTLTLRGGANNEGNTGIGIYFEKDY